MKSEKRRKLLAEKKARKEKAMKVPGHKSAYALKQRGIYPPNSPYRDRWKEFA